MFLSKTQTNLKKGLQAGYSLIEILVVLGLIGIALAIMFAAFGGAKDTVVVRQYTQEITSIRNAAVGWKGASRDYEGLTMTQLTSAGALNSAWGDGTGVNPNCGNYITEPWATDVTAFVLRVSNMPIQVCGAVARVFKDQVDPDIEAPECQGAGKTRMLKLRLRY